MENISLCPRPELSQSDPVRGSRIRYSQRWTLIADSNDRKSIKTVLPPGPCVPVSGEWVHAHSQTALSDSIEMLLCFFFFLPKNADSRELWTLGLRCCSVNMRPSGHIFGIVNQRADIPLHTPFLSIHIFFNHQSLFLVRSSGCWPDSLPSEAGGLLSGKQEASSSSRWGN